MFVKNSFCSSVCLQKLWFIIWKSHRFCLLFFYVQTLFHTCMEWVHKLPKIKLIVKSRFENWLHKVLNKNQRFSSISKINPNLTTASVFRNFFLFQIRISLSLACWNFSVQWFNIFIQLRYLSEKQMNKTKKDIGPLIDVHLAKHFR